MILLIRFILVTLIIYLLVRSFVNYFAEQEHDTKNNQKPGGDENKKEGVSKEVGEYIDYEEVDD